MESTQTAAPQIVDQATDAQDKQSPSVDEEKTQQQQMRIKTSPPSIRAAHLHRLYYFEAKALERAQIKATEDNTSLRWQRRKRHFFVLTNAAKPIYSKHGDENDLAPFFCVLQAMISFSSDRGDLIRSIECGSHRIVFVVDEPFYVVVVTRNNEPESIIRTQCYFLMRTLLSITSNQARAKLERNASADIRRLITGAENILDPLLREMPLNPSYLLQTYGAFPLSEALRKLIKKRLERHQGGTPPPQLLYMIVSCDRYVLFVAHSKNRKPLHPADLLIILNLVNAPHQMNNKENFLPLCLPNFTADGFLFAFIRYEYYYMSSQTSSEQPDYFVPPAMEGGEDGDSGVAEARRVKSSPLPLQDVLCPIPLTITLITNARDTHQQLKDYAESYLKDLKQQKVFDVLVGEMMNYLTPTYTFDEEDFDGLAALLNQTGLRQSRIAVPQPPPPQAPGTHSSVDGKGVGGQQTPTDTLSTQPPSPISNIREIPLAYDFSFSFYYPFQMNLPRFQLASSAFSGGGTFRDLWSTQQQTPSVTSCRHFLFIHSALHQHTQSGICPPYHTPAERRRLFGEYQRLIALMHSTTATPAVAATHHQRVQREKERARLAAQHARQLRTGASTHMGMQYESTDAQSSTTTALPAGTTMVGGMPVSWDSPPLDPDVTNLLGQLATPDTLEKAAGYASPLLTPSPSAILTGDFATAATQTDTADPYFYTSQSQTYSASGAASLTSGGSITSIPAACLPLPLVSLALLFRPSAETLVAATVSGFPHPSEKHKAPKGAPMRRGRQPQMPTRDLAASLPAQRFQPDPNDSSLAAATAASDGKTNPFTQVLSARNHLGTGLIGGDNGDAILLAAFDPSTPTANIANELWKICSWIKSQERCLFCRKDITW